MMQQFLRGKLIRFCCFQIWPLTISAGSTGHFEQCQGAAERRAASDSPRLGIVGCGVLTDSPRLGIVGYIVLTDSPRLGIVGYIVLTDSPRLGIAGCVVLTDLH